MNEGRKFESHHSEIEIRESKAMTELIYIRGNTYKITSTDSDELVSECVARIRIQSKDFYKRELQEELKRDGKSLIDAHAGMGIFYEVILKQESECR